MDQARWMVVISVIVCMVAVLTILNRNFGQIIPAIDANNIVSQPASSTETKHTSQVEALSTGPGKGGWRSLVSTRLKHRPPAEHTLSVEAPGIARDALLKMETEGRVLR